MLKYSYTLRDDIFRYGLRLASESSETIKRKNLMITGGCATQLFLGDYKELYRPTDDIDLASDGYLKKQERILWMNELVKKIREDGVSCTKGLCDSGAEVSLKGLLDDLFIRLNCFNQYYYLRYTEKIRGEFERSINETLYGINVKYQHPIDIIANKFDRILSRNKVLGIPFDRKINELINLLEEGEFDSIDIDLYKEDVEDIAAQRQINVEDLGRLSRRETQMIIEGYKIRKDIYDICCVIEVARKKNFNISKKEFLDALNLALVNYCPI
ncbi:MAG: hypothetical protein QXW97_02380 [Candidatus Pacearchaeota archaeon]